MLDVQAPGGVKLKLNRSLRRVEWDRDDDTAEDAARLEQALERIALLAKRRQEGMEEQAGAELAERLDSLIVQLRAALGQPE